MAEIAPTRKPDAWGWALYTAVVVWMGLLLVLPLGAMVAGVVPHLREVASELVSGEARDALLRSAVVAAVCVGINGVVGVVGGLLIVRSSWPGRRLLDALADLPFALSPVMTGLAFLLLFGRGGWFSTPLNLLGVQVAFAWPAVAIATLFVTLPFTLREVVLVLETLGDSEEQAAATLGATPWQTFARVTLPSLREALTVGATLTLSRALGEFGAVLVVGGDIAGKTATATTFLHRAMEERHEPAALGMALLLAALGTTLLAGLHRPPRS